MSERLNISDYETPAEDTGKANINADVSSDVLPLPDGAHFYDGTTVDQTDGGIVIDGAGNYYSLAVPERVPNGMESVSGNNPGTVQKNRMGQVFIHEHDTAQPTKYGIEMEYALLDPDSGEYVANRHPEELLTMSGEMGLKRPAEEPAELVAGYKQLAGEIVDDAEAQGALASPIAVIGQREPRPNEINPHPYVQFTADTLTRGTGFATEKIFRVHGNQDHTLMSNTAASLRAGEAMEAFNPLLMAPGLSGPFLHGGLAGNLANLPLSDAQQEHAKRVGIRPNDLEGAAQSWRYLLRRLGSTGAGIWLEPAPNGVAEYLEESHQRLADGELGTIDRFRGEHADRIRSVFNRQGEGTFEGCADDTYAGNVDVAAAKQLLRAALFTSFETMHMQGVDPVEFAAQALGTHMLSRQQRLDVAHDLSLRHVSRFGNDATVYGGKKPGGHLPLMLDIAEQAPYTVIDQDQRALLAKSYATVEQTKSALNTWAVEHNTNVPTIHAYHDLGLNNPAFYMQAHYDALRHENPNMTAQQAIREVERSVGLAFHQSVD